MFENSLIEDQRAKQPRQRKTFLSLAFAVHAAGFLSMLFVQYWSVDALPEQRTQTSFYTMVSVPPPPPPVPPAPAPEPAPPQPVAPPAAPVQPTAVPDVMPERAPEPPASSNVVTSTDALPTTGGDYLPGPADSGPVATAVEAADEVLEVGGAVARPVAVSQPQPRYPEIARRARIQGSVIVEAIIDRNGNVTDVKLRAGLPYGLSEAALAAVKQWKFEPATLNGKKVSVFYTLTVKFALK
jgi:protein TonB